MEFLKKFFPFSFTEKPDVKTLVVNTVVYVVIGIVIGVVLGIVGGLLYALPFVGTLVRLIGWIIDAYLTATIVLMFLHYFKVIK